MEPEKVLPMNRGALRVRIHQLLVSQGDTALYPPLLEDLCRGLDADWCRLVFLEDDGRQVLFITYWSQDPGGSSPVPEVIEPGQVSHDMEIRHRQPPLGSDAGAEAGLGVPESLFILCLGDHRHPEGYLEWGFRDRSLGKTDLLPSRPSLDLVREGLSVLRHYFMRKHELEALRHKSAYEMDIVQLLFRHSHDLIVSFDTRGRILQLNDAGRRLLCTGNDGDLGILHLESPDMATLLSMLGKGDCLNDLELVLMSNTYEALFFQGTIVPVRGADGEVESLHAICKNINDHIVIQRELAVQNHRLQELNDLLVRTQSQSIQNEKLASIGQLAAGVAHEINNPLAFIKSNHESMELFVERLYHYMAMLESHCGDYKTDRKEARVDKILIELPRLMKESRDGFARIMEIVSSLKDFSRQDSEGRPQDTDLNKLLRDTLVVARNHYRHVAELEVDCRLDEPVPVFPGLLNQVFLNLVVNAAQAIKAQKRPDPGRILVRTFKEGAWAVTSIADDGPGIPDEIADRLFDPFFTTKPVGEGTGLGLSVSYDIVVKRHGGQLTAHNRAEGGAEFVVRLPLPEVETLPPEVETLPVEEAD